MIQCKFIDNKGFNRLIAMPYDLDNLPSNWWLQLPVPPQRRFIRGAPNGDSFKDQARFHLVFPGHKYAMPVYEECEL